MKLKLLGLTLGATLLALSSTNASAHTDVYVGLDFGIPAPVVVERRPVYYDEYYYEPAPVYYYERPAYSRTHVYGRYETRYYDRHDRGRHRGHYKHHR